MERKMMLGGSSLMAVVALVGLILAGGNSSNGIKLAKGAESDYSIAFDKSTNKIGTDKFVSPSTVYSGSGFATTGLGNKIAFDYSSFANPTTVWQLIKGGGYFTNTDPISGMKSITLTKSNSASGFQVYWSETKTFTEANSATYDTTSALSFTCNFSGYAPNYIKVLALGTGTDAITSGSILFSCANQYPTLTLTQNIASAGTLSGGGIHKIGSNVTLTATPNAGYQFAGWYHGTELLSTSASYSFTMPTCVNNYDVEGRFLANTYNLVLSSEDTTKGAVTGAGSYDCGSSVSISAAAGNGYAFSGWYSGTTLVSSSNPYSFTMPYTDLNYVAKFSTNSYAVAITADSTMGSATGAGTYAYKGSVSLSATANSGYTFSGWYDGQTLISSANPYVFAMPYNDLAYTAKFTINSYTVSLISSEVATTPAGTCEVSGAGTYAFGSSATISAVPAAGYGFLGWYDGSTLVSSSNSYTFTVPAKNISYVAKYSKKYHVSVTSFDETKGTITGAGDFAYSSNVTVTGTGLGKYNSVTWYDDSFASVSTDLIYTFAMPEADVNLSADFGTRYTVTFKNWDGTVLQRGKWDEGTTPAYSGSTPTRPSDDLHTYTFSEWSPVIASVTMNATYTATYTSSAVPLGDSFALGKYPQTVVEDATLKAALASATDTDSDGYLEYGSNEYKEVEGTPYESGYKSTSGNTNFVTGTTYYFKVEPIQWKVLSGKGATTGLVISEKILTNIAFSTYSKNRTISNSTVSPSNYKYSTLRAMLNCYDEFSYSGKGFLDVAFTSEEKTCIATTTVDNSASTANTAFTGFACANTNDKIFALSYMDLCNTDYGFDSGTFTYDMVRQGTLTDYARATGAQMSTDSSYYGKGCWWSRSPYSDDSHYGSFASYVRFSSVVSYDSVRNAHYGVRPSFTVNLA